LLEKLSKDRSEVSASAQIMLRNYAGDRWPSMNHKGRIGRLASVLGFSPRRVRSLYQNEPGVRLRADEMAAIDNLRRAREEAKNVRASQAEYRALEARIAALEALFAGVDEEHGRPYLDGFRAMAFGDGGAAVGGSREDGPPDQSGKGD
jgi:hypothetical protein